MSVWGAVKRFRHTSRKAVKVAILGALGRVGRHVALLLKQNHDITEIALHDAANTEGMREDLSHIDYNPKVTAYMGDENLSKAVSCSQLVIVCCGEGLSEKKKTREELFEGNAGHIVNIARTVVQTNPELPFIYIVTNPVNSLVPLMAEALTKLDQYDPKKLFGNAIINKIRARTFIGQLTERDPSKIQLPVIGGHSTKSILPIISKADPDYNLKDKEIENIIKRTQNASLKLLETYKTAGGFMSCSYSAAKFCNSAVKALTGKTVREVAFIPCQLVTDLDYFTSSFSMNSDGIKDIDRLPDMNAYESTLFDQAVKDIQSNVKVAKEFMKSQSSEK